MKLTEILSGNANVAEWESKGYELPKYDIAAVAKKTHDEPTWVHFGAGNIFRAFPAAILNDALNTGKYDRGVIVAESFDYEIIDKAYRPYGNLSLLVSLQSSGTIEKKVIASVTESLKADFQFTEEERAENVNIGVSMMKGNTVLREAIDSVLSEMTVDDFNSLMETAISVQPLSEG